MSVRLNLLIVALLTSSGCVISSSSPLTPTKATWRLSGTVFRMDGVRVGAPLAGAQLTVVTAGTSANVHVATDAQGHYLFQSLESGRLNLNIAAPGFASANPLVDLYSDTNVDFALVPQ